MSVINLLFTYPIPPMLGGVVGSRDLDGKNAIFGIIAKEKCPEKLVESTGT